MGGTILPVAHGIMSEDKKGGQFHESSQPYGRPRIVTENEERCAIGTQLGERESVHDRGHGMFTDPKVQVLPSRSVGLEVSRAVIGQLRFVGGTEIGRAP